MVLEAGGRGGAEEKEEKEKIPHMCESIGHQPLRVRFPKRKARNIPGLGIFWFCVLLFLLASYLT